MAGTSWGRWAAQSLLRTVRMSVDLQDENAKKEILICLCMLLTVCASQYECSAHWQHWILYIYKYICAISKPLLSTLCYCLPRLCYNCAIHSHKINIRYLNIGKNIVFDVGCRVGGGFGRAGRTSSVIGCACNMIIWPYSMCCIWTNGGETPWGTGAMEGTCGRDNILQTS